MAIVVLVNLGLVLFDLSYVPWRDYYLRVFPKATLWYGEQFKGIEPHYFTVNYLQTVDRLENQVAATGLESPQAAALLAELRNQSIEMVDENPFDLSNKSGTLERIKNRMRQRTKAKSSKEAFTVFWSADYLKQAGWLSSIQFFDRSIRPLISTNYYRHIGENGEPIDRFWQIDLIFSALFALELAARTLYFTRRYPSTTWLDALIWRWYDLLLLLPFWRWLRVIPAGVRLDQAGLVNFQPINNRIIRSFVTSVAVELTEVVVVRILEQTQNALRQGDWVEQLLQSSTRRRYVDLNGVNEVEMISQRLIQVLVYRVMPRLKPQIDAFLHHSVTRALGASPIYAGLQRLPGVHDLSEQLTRQLVSELSQNLYLAITETLEDQVGAELMRQLVTSLGETFRTEIQQDGAIEEIRSLVVDLLDEVKFNYINQISQEDWEKQQATRKRLYEITQSSSNPKLMR